MIQNINELIQFLYEYLEFFILRMFFSNGNTIVVIYLFI